MMKLPLQSAGNKSSALVGGPLQSAVRAAKTEIVVGSDGKFYDCRIKYVEGTTTYYDCLGLDIEPGGGRIYIPPEPDVCWTETKCVLGVALCEEHCLPAGGGPETVGRLQYCCG